MDSSRKCVQNIESNYHPLMKLWDVSLAVDKLDSEMKTRVIGVQNQMRNFEFFYGLNLSQRLLAISENLSKNLAKRNNACTKWPSSCSANCLDLSKNAIK